MKKVILILFVLSTFFFVFAQDNMKKYVSAENGLILRDMPSTKGKKVKKIPYGAEVLIIDQSLKQEKIENKESYWFKISYNGKMGWVFGGYLETSDPKKFKINNAVSLGKFSFKGLKHASRKQDIIALMGKDYKQVEPEYECGFYSLDQGEKYYQLIYKDVTFIGNDEEKYIIEKIVFNGITNYKLVCGTLVIDKNTTVDDLIEYLGEDQMYRLESESSSEVRINVPIFKGSDDAYIIILDKNDRIRQIEYWSPC